MIYVNGQDIHKLICANLSNNQDQVLVDQTDSGPEGYMKAFCSFLEKINCSLNDIEKLFVVIGPGSATALRGSLSLINTLAFTKGIGLVGIEKKSDEQDIDTINKILEQGLSTFEVKNVLIPIYEHNPRITISTKDVLRRKV
ncbi:hypothetical protein A2317_00305 [Candidatus Uhrbacteria bacterium RIFOXYB2_FULL_41_10]|nr:MAG: hypothetical protein A2317_00305 [Candidatus Uhrbacteria bacterium RIFOXYB2_FULL_41_10]